MRERTPFNQVMACKNSYVQRIIQVVQRAAEKSCRRACQLFCCRLDTLLRNALSCCPAQTHQPVEATAAQAVTLRSLPSTILIVNISNSTLVDCVIWNDTYQSVVAESQPLMQKPEHRLPDEGRCSCRRGQQGEAQASASASPPPLYHRLPSAEPPSINIHNSHLNCVIIGDNNYMHAEQIHSTETEEPPV